MQKSKLLYVPTWRDELFTSYDHHNIMTEHDNFLSENMPFTSHKMVQWFSFIKCIVSALVTLSLCM